MTKLRRVFACLAAGSLLPLTACGTPPEITAQETLFRPIALSETVLTVDPEGMSQGEYEVLVSLQGITARDGKADIYLRTGNYAAYQEAYDAAWPEQKFQEFSGTVWELAALFSAEITDVGFVLYAADEEGAGVNLAATVSAAEGWLGVPEGLREAAQAAGFVCKRDLRELKGGYAQQQRSLFEEYRERLNPGILVHQPPGNTALRDFAIAQGAFCFYAQGSGGSLLETRQEQQLYREVWAWAQPNAQVFGVWNKAGEVNFVQKLSRAGLVMLPADHMRNGSTLMGFAAAQLPLQQPYENREMQAQAGKHYAALMLSDGDNLQWLLGDAFFRGTLYERTQSDDSFPMSFTYAPLMAELFPFVTSYHYGLLGDGMQLVCGVSGLGYTNQTLYPAQAREAYAALTARYMAKADLRVMQLLDKRKGSAAAFDRKVDEILSPFAAQEAIAGGVWYLDPGKYESGGGKVYSVGGKLWPSNRLSFWSPDGSPDSVSDEWIQSVADAINAYPRDPASAEGYSVINVHPWSIGYADVQHLVSLLDEDVVLVSAEELLTLMAEAIE